MLRRASAARSAITSVICSRPPPWIARKPKRERSRLASTTPASASSSERDCGAGDRRTRRAAGATARDPSGAGSRSSAAGSPCCIAPVDDAFQVAVSRRAEFDPVVDVDPRFRRTVFGLHRQPVAPVAHRHAFGAVERDQVVVATRARRRRAPEAPSNGSTVATPRSIDQPVVVGEHGPPRIDGVGTALSHLLHAQVGPVREIGMTAPLRHDVDVSRANYLRCRERLLSARLIP